MTSRSKGDCLRLRLLISDLAVVAKLQIDVVHAKSWRHRLNPTPLPTVLQDPKSVALLIMRLAKRIFGSDIRLGGHRGLLASQPSF